MTIFEILEYIREMRHGDVLINDGATTWSIDNLIEALQGSADSADYWYDGESIGRFDSDGFKGDICYALIGPTLLDVLIKVRRERGADTILEDDVSRVYIDDIISRIQHQRQTDAACISPGHEHLAPYAQHNDAIYNNTGVVFKILTRVDA